MSAPLIHVARRTFVPRYNRGTPTAVMLDSVRLEVSAGIDRRRKSDLGQFFTPSGTARFMAGLFSEGSGTARLLDAGAGLGSLTCAFLDRWRDDGFHFQRVDATVYEIDDLLRRHLALALESYATRPDMGVRVFGGDFIGQAVNQLQLQPAERFTHAILNPPYKKISSQSHHRLWLRAVGIETVNLYTAFTALALAMLEPGGQMVAIIPRSFCNGPYYRPFREFMLARAAIRRLHLFAARDRAFRDDAVLQENLIMLLERGGEPNGVVVSTSTDDQFSDYWEHLCPFDRIVFPDDPERFIHVPTVAESCGQLPPAFRCSLGDIGVEVSTGPVVDFRLKAHLRDTPEPGTVPLLYPGHFAGTRLEWPKIGKKPNAIAYNRETEKWLYPNGCYAVVRRFSSKEERRRIMASLITPDPFEAAYLGLENHLNVFHARRQGLSEDLARGLVVYLNATMTDEWFRRFSGHTQVNATDLRLLKYPSRDTLISLGQWAKGKGVLSQKQIDNKINSLV